jgi:gas vesicle protein GvpL/GvpF
MLYLYGVTLAGREQPGMGGLGAPPERVRLVESGPVAAAVSELPDDYVVQDEDARAHLQVLIGLLDSGPVLPVRMGTVARSPDDIRSDVLDSARDDLVRRLNDLDGLVELHVDVDDDEGRSIAELTRSGRLTAHPGADLASRIEFGQRVAELLIEHRRQVAEEIVDALRPLASRDAPRSTIRSAEDPLLRWAFLVPLDEIGKFDHAVAGIRNAHPELNLSYTGPLPPSHFVDWAPGAESPSTPTDSFQAQGAWGWE